VLTNQQETLFIFMSFLNTLFVKFFLNKKIIIYFIYLTFIFFYVNFFNLTSIAHCAENIMDNTTEENPDNSKKTYFYIFTAVATISLIAAAYFFSQGGSGGFGSSTIQPENSPFSIDQIISNNVNAFIGDKNIIAEQQQQIERLTAEKTNIVRYYENFAARENMYKQIITAQKVQSNVDFGILYTTTLFVGWGFAGLLATLELKTGLPPSTLLYYVYISPILKILSYIY
jgi:hypothetical protein